MKKNIVVTGAYGGIGKAISVELSRLGHHVWILGRDESKLNNLKKEIFDGTGNTDVTVVALDLSLKSEILRFIENWQDPLHVLINNAATTPIERMETEEGIEMQFAVNVMSYFWLTKYLTCSLNTSAPARVVNVASHYAGGLDLCDLQFKTKRYNNDAAYKQSKQANRMLTIAFAERLLPLGVTVNSCHPGDVNTKLSNSLGFAGATSPKDGAKTPVLLATDPSFDYITGQFYSHLKEVSEEFAWNREAIDSLYEICEKLS